MSILDSLHITQTPSICQNDCKSGMMGLMFFIPGLGIIPGCDVVLPQKISDIFLSWLEIDSEQKFVVDSNESQIYSVISTLKSEDGSYIGVTIQDQLGVPSYLYLKTIQDDQHLIWSESTPGGGCDCEPLDNEIILEICNVEY